MATRAGHCFCSLGSDLPAKKTHLGTSAWDVAMKRQSNQRGTTRGTREQSQVLFSSFKDSSKHPEQAENFSRSGDFLIALSGLQGKVRAEYLRFFCQFSENIFQVCDACAMVLVGGHVVSLGKEEERLNSGEVKQRMKTRQVRPSDFCAESPGLGTVW